MLGGKYWCGNIWTWMYFVPKARQMTARVLYGTFRRPNKGGMQPDRGYHRVQRRT